MSKATEYWEKRRQLEDLARYKLETDTTKMLQEIFPEALKRIQEKLLSQADLHNMTQAELLADYNKRDQAKYRKYIDQNYQELMNSDEKYQEFIDEFFPAYDYAKVNRLLQIRTDIFSELASSVIKKDANGKFERRLEDIINRTYNTNAGPMAFLTGAELNMLPKSEIQDLLNYPWSGRTFSNRLWGNVSALEKKLSEAISNAVASGDGVRAALISMHSDTEISDMFKKEEKKFDRAIENLVRTEYSHFAVQGIRKSVSKAGINERQVWTAEDERVCSICGAWHGKTITDEPGPPFHTVCRCTEIPKMPKLDTEAIDAEYEALFGDMLDEFASKNWGIKIRHPKTKGRKGRRP